MPVPELYRWCEIAYELAVEGLGLGRVIARPFVGTPGTFIRTANRHDYAMPPVQETLLDRLVAHGHEVTAIGKISDLFAGRGIARAWPSASDDDGNGSGGARPRHVPRGLVFANLVDFDTQYGHRNDMAGYAANLERFDARLDGVAAEACGRRSADHHGRSRQRPDDAEHRSFARARAGARMLARGSGPAWTSGREPRSPISGRRSRTSSASPRFAHGTSFLPQIV